VAPSDVAQRDSSEERAIQHLRRAGQEATEVPGIPPGTSARPIGHVGVVGGGMMGRGIAMSFLNAGIPVTLVETSDESLWTALGEIRALYDASASKGTVTGEAVSERLALLRGSVGDAALGTVDLAIEAVYEDLSLKKQVCVRLGQICKPGAIIATNTSTLDVDELADASGRPADVVGLHFFSPAHVMRMLEVVRAARTASDVVATSMQLAGRIGKVAVVSGVCYGFIGNRMMEPYMREAERLLLEGATPPDVDAAVEEIGMAMGPCRMLDMAGVDVGARTVIERAKAGALPDDPTYRILVRRLFDLGRLGRKTGAGYYRYEGRTAIPDPAFERIARQLAGEHGIERRADIGRQEILERLLFPLINEAARILEEGIACRGGDIDVVWTAGYGFPTRLGGPLFFADEVGLLEIVSRLQELGRRLGNCHGYWTPANLLVDLSSRGGRLSEWHVLS